MFKIKFIYWCLVSFIGFELVSPCELNFRNSLPIFVKNFGSKKIIFKPHGTSLQLQRDESLLAYCNTGIMYQTETARSGYPYGYENRDMDQVLGVNTSEIICDSNDKISFKDKVNSNSRTLTIFCASQSTYELYESKKALSNCKSYNSYAIGMPLQTFGVGNDIKVGICYDLDKTALKFASFVTNSNSDVGVFDKQKQIDALPVELSEKVGSLKTYFQFMSESTFTEAKANMRSSQNALLNTFEFDLTSLLQDEPLNGELGNFAYIFNTMWWRQLRQQNWRYFLDALRERTHSAKYLVSMGTYGNATIPSTQGNCSSFKSEVVSVSKGNMVVTAPAYIWAYLKPLTDADEEEFGVIAHNSPYAANPGFNEICSVDICDDVEWLKNSAFGNLRLLPTLGYTFCCRPEEVAKIIDYFPISIYEMEINQTTQRSLTTEEVI